LAAVSRIAALFALPTATAPFVGRAAELSALREILAHPPSAVVITGEPGVGKSRLVAEALTAVPGRLIVAHCDDLREPLPLGPILDGLRILERSADLPLDPARLDPSTGVFAPYLTARLPPIPEPLYDQLAERTRLLHAMAALLGALAPVVVALEDLHMADPATVEFIDHAAAHPVPGLSLVITTRSPRPGPHRIDLHPLSVAEVGELAAALRETRIDAGQPATTPHETRIDPAFAQRLHNWTAGLPFVVEEAVRTLKDRDDLAVPPLLRDMLHWRLRTLDEPARDILGAAAVLGRSADEWTLAAVLETDVESVTAALSRARDAGLLHESLRFRHALARQVVYDLLPAAARRMLHLRTARVLEGRLPRPVARLAHHYRQAESPADHARNAEAAADLATARGDDATAARFLLPTMTYVDIPRRVRARLAVKLGRSAIEGVTQADAIPALRPLLADRRLPPGARGELGLALGRMLRQQGEAGQGYEEIERAVPYLRHPGRRARALAILSAPDTVVGRHVDDHLRYCVLARRAARESGDPSAMLAVEIARCSLRIEMGDEDAWPAVEAALADPRLADHPRDHARAGLNWAQGALHAGEPERAAALLTIVRGLPVTAEYARLQPVVELTEFALDLAADRLDGLAERIERFLARPDRLPLAMLDARLHLARVRHRTGDTGRAEADLREVIASAARVSAVWPLVPAHIALAALLRDLGRPFEADARTALSLVKAKGLPRWGRLL
jgi:hypothetical protein